MKGLIIVIISISKINIIAIEMLSQDISPWSIYDNSFNDQSLHQQNIKNHKKPGNLASTKSKKNKQSAQFNSLPENDRISIEHRQLYRGIQSIALLKIIKNQLDSQRHQSTRQISEQFQQNKPIHKPHFNDYFSNHQFSDYQREAQSNKNKHVYSKQSAKELDKLVKNNLQIGSMDMKYPSPKKISLDIEIEHNDYTPKFPSFPGKRKRNFVFVPESEQLQEYGNIAIFQYFYSPIDKQPKSTSFERNKLLNHIKQSPDKDKAMHNVGYNFFSPQQ